MARGKKYTEARKSIEPGKRYPLRDAVELMVGTGQGQV